MLKPQDQPNRLLTVAELADWLCVSGSLVYQLVEAGELPAYRIGNGRGAIRFRSVDIESYLDSCRTNYIPQEPARRLRPKLKHIRIE